MAAKRKLVKTKTKEKTAPNNDAPATIRKAPRITHDMSPSYSGTSSTITSRMSRTPIDFSRFNTIADAKLTARDRSAINDLASTYGKRQFQRGNLDTGILRRLGARGIIAHVSGSDVSLETRFKLTPLGIREAA